MELTKAQAVAMATRAGFDTEDGRTVVHGMGRFTGADWSLPGVVEAIEQSTDLRWWPHPFGHHLRVDGPSGTWHFNVGDAEPTAADLTGGA